ATNAMHYEWQHCTNDETRRLLLLQNAAFLPLFRGTTDDKNKAVRIDELEPGRLNSSGAEAVSEIFAEISQDRLSAAREVLAYAKEHPEPKEFIGAARLLIFLKGRDAHDYKFSSAVLEDYLHLASPWRER